MSEPDDVAFAALQMAETLTEGIKALQIATERELKAAGAMRASVQAAIDALPAKMTESARSLHAVWFPQAVQELSAVKVAFRSQIDELEAAKKALVVFSTKMKTYMILVAFIAGAGCATALGNWGNTETSRHVLERLDSTQQQLHNEEELVRDLMEKQAEVDRLSRHAGRGGRSRAQN